MEYHVDTPIKTQRILSYCPGILGLERGLKRSGLPHKTIAFLEIEAFIVANLVAQMETGILDSAPIWSNIKNFDAKPFRNKVHGIVGGYPCPPFSNAGKRKGAEDERHLWPYILEQIKIIGPQWVYFENVAGHITLGYEEVRRSLSDIGYRVEEGIFTAEEVGAPHRRERLFILGVMENADILRWGRWYLGNQGRGECAVQTSGSSAALEQSVAQGNAGCVGQAQRQLKTTRIEQQCSEVGQVGLANSTSTRRKIARPAGKRQLSKESAAGLDDRPKQRCTPVEHSTGRRDGELPNEISEGQGCRTIGTSSTLGGEKVADTGSARNEIGVSGQNKGQEGQSVVVDDNCNGYRFPAGQGVYQHPWEEPRTTKSRMEYTVDGYSFTEDLHRAIGNSVVEQTAELAFISLLEKHLK